MMMRSPTTKSVSTTRRSLIVGLLLLSAVALAQKVGSKPVIQVWKTPGRGCCRDWLAHLRDNESDVVVHDVEEAVEARRKAGMSERYASCYTGVIQDYALEDHVPVREAKRLLQGCPKAIGLAVPSMPLGAPGMDRPAYGSRRMPYNVLLIGLDGQTTMFRTYSWWSITVSLASVIVPSVRVPW